MEKIRVEKQIGEFTLSFETGILAKQAAGAVLVELPGRAQELAPCFSILPTVLDQLWFVIKRVQVRRATSHAKEDDAFGLGFKVRLLGGERAGVISSIACGCR